MTIFTAIWKLLRDIFMEGMLRRTADGRRLGFFSRRGWGANFMFAGIVGFAIGVVWTGQRAHFEIDAIETTSEVLTVQPKTTRNGQRVYQLTLRWTDSDGTEHVTVPRVSASYYDVPAGTTLDIKYDPDDLEDVRVTMKEEPWYIPGLILAGSLITCVLGRLLRGNPKMR